MRTSKEMADDVLKIRDEYEKQNMERNKIIKKTAGIAAVACSFCIMAGTLLYFKLNKPETPDKSALEVPSVTDVTTVSEEQAAVTAEEKADVTEKNVKVTEENNPVTEAVSEVSGTEQTAAVSETVKTENTEKSGVKESPKPSSDTGKKQDTAAVTKTAVTEKQSVPEVTKNPVTEKEPVKEVTKAEVTEKQPAPDVTRTQAISFEEKEVKDDTPEIPESPKPSNATPKPMSTVRPSERPSVSPSVIPVKEAVPAETQYVAEQPRPSSAIVSASPKPVAASPKPSSPEESPEYEPESVSSSEEEVQKECAPVSSDIQSAFDEVINFTVVNNTDCYLYFKNDDQILVILCQTPEDVQMISDHISEKCYDESWFECKVNDIIIDLPAQKTDDIEKQCKQISRFMFQNDIYGYVKIDEFENEDKIFVLLNDASSENVAKIRYFLSMYSINLNNVKIKNV